LLVFNYFNFRKKAVCFAGDVGSLSIGFIIIFLIVKLIVVSGNFIFVFLLCVYGVDTIFTIIHRLMLKENIFKAHKLHFFQVMVNRTGISHLKMSLIYIVLQLIIDIILIVSLELSQVIQYGIGMLVAACLGLVYIILKPRMLETSAIN
jgi:UDP-N-acetylmuramyl pentapeptide phosphotransferase/UDP-N-acetylglucosamine-1-phosphate transferase